ncbi:MAG: helix-turn-helix domain-containing protein [Devosia sp.]|nr:helix-turn-helix domain-containing protein [Devosia sp.]
MRNHPSQAQHRDTLHSGPVMFLDNPSSDSAPAAELMTVLETAAFLTISEKGVRRLQHARRLPFIKVGASVRFAKRDLLAYLESRRVKPLDS